MSIYSNGAPVRLAIADGMPPLTRPLVQPLPCTGGVRGYALGGWAPRRHGVVVAISGHWYHSEDKQPGGRWTCRGCRATGGLGDVIDPKLARCPKPPSAQDVASALLGRTAVAA